MLGSRPNDSNGSYVWDKEATDIERVRHRNGLTPDEGITALNPAGVLGNEPNDLSELRNWRTAARLIEAQLEPDLDFAPEEPRRRGPSIRM